MRLPPRYHGPVKRVVEQIIGWATFETLVLMSLVQWATIRAAAGGDARVVIGLVFAIALIASPVLITFVLTRSQQAFDQAFRKPEADGALR